ncbi:GRB2-related adapter protein-like isoform X1 [Xiphophorus hellerii]|uniref:GRB2-related adapter protein-like isoform X1 n=1 Tax=Xiphophorus hellerii TaxID=8084 RepID=UPI0013B39983|nr:GRB2-related adapter protein-like isoform X1 [Xiphophorus hellerii]
MEAVALFSFTASEADEISFQKGDIVKVVEMERDSFWFTAEIEGKRGFIPENYISLHPHLWFAGAISRLEAEQRLCWQDPGVFLVRASESAPGEFSLSVSYGDMVEHFRVLEDGGQYYIWDKAFCSLNRLVEFYRAHSITMEKVVHLRDYPSFHLNSHLGLNPYPNPYNSNSLESIHSAHRRPNPSPRDWQTSAPSLKPVLAQKPRVARALCDYTPSQTTHLHFQRDEIIDLLDCSSSLSWRGSCRGRVGIFPPEFVQPVLH